MVALAASQLSGSRLCGDAARPRRLSRGSMKRLTADALLENGPQGGPGSPQERRHRRILEEEAYLEAAAAVAEDDPQLLHQVLSKDYEVSTQCKSLAQGRLGAVVLDRVRRSFLGASVAHPRSALRSQRLQQLHGDLAWAEGFAQSCAAEAQVELERYRKNIQALDAVARAQGLREEALACAAEEADAEAVVVAARGLPMESAAASERVAAIAAKRGRIIGEAMDLLRHWKGNSEVVRRLVSACLAIADAGGDEFKLEMDRRGLGVLVSTVADVWAKRPEVARSSMLLLGVVSIEHLISHIEEALHKDGTIVFLGLEALNRLTKDSPCTVDELVTQGARELLDEVEAAWGSNRMISLYTLNLRRRLRKSKATTLKLRKKASAPEDIIRIRGCFEAIDADGNGYIDAKEMSLAFQMVGIKATPATVKEAMAEVDVDGSGHMEWPEFLLLMSKFGKRQSMEAQFSEDRLVDLHQAFSLFDLDGNGALDVQELGSVMRSVGLSPTDFEIRAMISEVDADGSGSIDWPEFLYLMSRKAVDPDNQHRLAFEFFDKGSYGVIHKDDFIQQMRVLSDEFSAEDLEDMVLEAKFENGDLDVITYQEFVKMMMRP